VDLLFSRTVVEPLEGCFARILQKMLSISPSFFEIRDSRSIPSFLDVLVYINRGRYPLSTINRPCLDKVGIGRASVLGDVQSRHFHLVRYTKDTRHTTHEHEP
jgi:hypothetical protein